MMLQLIRYEGYTREEAHNIFSPYAKFTPQTGTWGLQGIVPIRNTNDYVFFVTLGIKQADHMFSEGITTDGVLTWQSQPKQNLKNSVIKKFIKHDETVDNIYLFYRVEQTNKIYIYLGKLAYLSHDPYLENPVYFTWKILDWNPPKHIKELCKIGNINSLPSYSQDSYFSGSKGKHYCFQNIDFIKVHNTNTETGNYGEDLVLELEKSSLRNAGYHELADRVYLTRERLGNNAPFDILSYYENGKEKYIEVKTTTDKRKTHEFYISERELNFYRNNPKQYLLYRIYNLNKKTGEFEYFTIQELDRFSTFKATTYKATISESFYCK